MQHPYRNAGLILSRGETIFTLLSVSSDGRLEGFFVAAGFQLV